MLKILKLCLQNDAAAKININLGKLRSIVEVIEEGILVKVVDSCWIFSTEWSDTFRSFFVCGKKEESRKKYIITVQKNFSFLRRFDRKNTVSGISRNLIDKFVFK